MTLAIVQCYVDHYVTAYLAYDSMEQSAVKKQRCFDCVAVLLGME